MQFTKNYSDKTAKLKELLEQSDAIVVGAGAGLSVAAGFTYSGERFRKYFHDFEEKYGFHDMYSGGFYPYETAEEFWAYWSRYILVNRYTEPPKPVYNAIIALLKDKNYFVITTNVDHCFQKAGFDKQRLFYTQGDYGFFQCSVPCHDKTYDNEELIRRMAEEQKDMKIPSSLIPRCPVCGEPMTTNLRSDDKFVEDDGWHAACRRYTDFLKQNAKKKVLFLELGVGYNTPGIIKYPFWEMTSENKSAFYVSVNAEQPYVPSEISARSLTFTADISILLEELEKN